MDNQIKLSLLYDFYGELLTQHQREICEYSFYDDLSLAEIAENTGVSRQAVHDILKRSSKLLNDYEDKLHLLQRFISIKDEVNKIKSLAESGSKKDILDICEHIIEEL